MVYKEKYRNIIWRKVVYSNLWYPFNKPDFIDWCSNWWTRYLAQALLVFIFVTFSYNHHFCQIIVSKHILYTSKYNRFSKVWYFISVFNLYYAKYINKLKAYCYVLPCNFSRMFVFGLVCPKLLKLKNETV